ncbi:MAG: choice-of-anchor D domain-containing protein [Verrucomicrobia bacterium]|nr:choice-of-anchor D domain-containing protein [Verrucomicrobiota bacterium]MBT7067101.1 choice-of-anchor D domain-containing protein [Verrucomicrobiota bacterium]MBT7699235.1 choice-of-anchor D domain-containing protein [Verrucomicrobiota bacterium]
MKAGAGNRSATAARGVAILFGLLFLASPARAISPDRFEPNAVDGPTIWGATSYRLENGLTLHSSTDEDYFNVSLAQGQRVGMLFDHSQGDLDLQLIWPQGAASIAPMWNMVVGESSSTTDNEMVALDSAPMSVAIRVYGKTGTETHPDYDLFIAGPLSQPTVGGDLDYGDLDIGSNVVRMLTIHNNDSFEPLEIRYVQPPYGFTGGWTGNIPPEATQQVPITFAPTLQHEYSGTVRVRSYNTDQVEYAISGRGVQSTIRLLGDLSFGEVEVGSRSNRTLTICNDGNQALAVAGVSTPPHFQCDWSGSIAGGSSNGLEVVFSPIAQQAYTGAVVVSSDADMGNGTTNTYGSGTVTTSLDSDGDGVCNAHEFIAGTLPDDITSFFHVDSVDQVSSNTYAIEWLGVAGRTYRLYECTNLTEGFVLSLPEIPYSTPTNRLVMPFAGGPIFIRLGVYLSNDL